MKSKRKNAQKAADLKRLNTLVTKWHRTRSRKVKLALMRQISNANDRFHARWKTDGVATLLGEGSK